MSFTDTRAIERKAGVPACIACTKFLGKNTEGRLVPNSK